MASSQHSRVWFSPHGTEWEAETYEEALEMERDSLVEQYQALREAAQAYRDAEAESDRTGEWEPAREAAVVLDELLGSNPAKRLNLSDELGGF